MLSQFAATTMSRATSRGSDPGSRPGSCPAAWSSARGDVDRVDEDVEADAKGQALVGAQVVVLQIERLQPGVVGAGAVPFGEALDEPLLGHPVDLVGDGGGVAFEPLQDGLPQRQHLATDLGADRGQPVGAFVLLCPLAAIATGSPARSSAVRCAAGPCGATTGRDSPGGWPRPDWPGRGRRRADRPRSSPA